jgi:hypothetical protein
LLIFIGACGGVAFGVLALFLRQKLGIDRCDEVLCVLHLTKLEEGLATVETGVSSAFFQMSQASAGEKLVVRKSEATWPGLAVVGALVVGAVGMYRWTHPAVRMMNFGGEEVTVFADGRRLAVVPGIPSEAPNDGLLVRVPWGARVLEARTGGGQLIDRSYERIGNAEVELYVPVKAGQCLWIEQEVYGSVSGARSSRKRLSQRVSFFAIDDRIDAFFLGNPKADGADRMFSGGVRRALRHGPCLDSERER